MRDSLTLGRFAGIQVGVNWSWLVVFALIVWTLYSATLLALAGLPEAVDGVLAWLGYTNLALLAFSS